MLIRKRTIILFVISMLLMSSFYATGSSVLKAESLYHEHDVSVDEFFFEDPLLDEDYVLLDGDESITVSEDPGSESLIYVQVGIRHTSNSIYHSSITLSGSNGISVKDPVTGTIFVNTDPDQRVTFSNTSVGVQFQHGGVTYIKPSLLIEPKTSSTTITNVYGINSTTITRLNGPEVYAVNNQGSISTVELNGSYVVSRNGTSSFNIETSTTSTTESYIRHHISDTSSRAYRGSFKIDKPNVSDALVLVNLIDIENYLYGVVPREMPASWHIEALKVQAVAARSYSYRKIQSSSHAHFDICNSACCQVYGGMNDEHQESNRAVDLTRGEFAVYNNRVIEALYSSSSGGHTENSENAWSSVVAYLRGVPDPGDAYDNRFYEWTVETSLEDIRTRILSQTGINVGDIINIYSSKPKTISGRNSEITVQGTEQTLVISSQSQMRRRFDRDVLSAMFDIEFYPGEKAVFIGGGNGHGVGMSQYGARGMAVDGKTYKQIISHYYTGATVQKLYD